MNATSEARKHERSPEDTNDWRCPFCGNAEHFIGYDDHGFPGEEEDTHDDRCPYLAGHECTCEVTLTQRFRVPEGGGTADLDYEAFEGGGSGAEIGSYDRLDCGVCGRTIFGPNEREEQVAAERG